LIDEGKGVVGGRVKGRDGGRGGMEEGEGLLWVKYKCKYRKNV
jgi:hypothetical protein